MKSSSMQTSRKSNHAIDSSSACICRLCGATAKDIFVDLGMSPLCQNRITPPQLNHMEPFYPLRVFLCGECYLVQLQEYVAPDEIFSDYAYFSSYSKSWVEHARQYCEGVVERFSLDANSQVVEIASNDGYLLQHFVKMNIPCLGIEPAENVAEEAIKNGVPTITKFFGTTTASEVKDSHGSANLIVGNNVLAHVPDLNDFLSGMKHLLSDSGVVTMEFPHLERLIAGNQFDTIYHEHFSYFSFLVAKSAFERNGMRIFDVEEIRTHGGSLRIFACHKECEEHNETDRVESLIKREIELGYTDKSFYLRFKDNVEATKRNILKFLIEAKNKGKVVVGYGAPGKGNTLLNYCGIRVDFLSYTVDISPHKQGTYTPGTHIPVLHPDQIRQTRPDYVFILPWNLKDEIVKQNGFIREWGGKFVVPIPSISIVD